jgi:sigma-54-specific transcriptional regulator
VNCGALSPTLMESELFGHERGSFTGALANRPGWFEVAHGGTLFLDEIGALPVAAQVKLLRVLQEREVVRIGARKAIRIDVRLIAATNANLEQAVADGRFREDLYYRLHVAPLAIAPLRERPGDLEPLARHFLTTHAATLGIAHADLDATALDRLRSHPWPGNIRELENALHHALLVCRDGRVTAADLKPACAPPVRSATPPPAPLSPPVATAPPDARDALRSAILALLESDSPNLHREIEEIVFRTGYEYSDNNQLRMARLLGVSRNVVRARLLEYGVLAPGARKQEAPGATP